MDVKLIREKLELYFPDAEWHELVGRDKEFQGFGSIVLGMGCLVEEDSRALTVPEIRLFFAPDIEQNWGQRVSIDFDVEGETIEEVVEKFEKTRIKILKAIRNAAPRQ